MDSYEFCRNPVTVGTSLYDWDPREIKMTPSLWNASMDDAARFGGELTRYFLSGVDLVGDRRYVTVDSKIHMLMPGMIPAIPGWHTDGVPRQGDGTPSGGDPLLDVQERLDGQGCAPRYHLFVTGEFCSTEFLPNPVTLDLESDATLYAQMTRQVRDNDLAEEVFTAPAATWINWDWWNIHRAVPANDAGWRMLIRVTESDFLPPQTNIRQVIRLHNPVYIQQSEFGW